MITAVHKHGIAKGFSAGILRIGRCHGSFFDGGKDPVPEEIIWKDLLADYKKFRHQKGIK
jgi:putative component of membrane protein insertase Oxa1/YidC/SpoIIIJ protein YidD